MPATWLPCPMCFHPADPEARFCSKCGASLDAAASVAIPRGASLPEATMAFVRPNAPPPPTTTTADSEAPESLFAGRYRIDGEIGRGSFGIVARGWDMTTNSPVAIKMLPGLSQVEPEERKGVMESFRREAQALAWLRHPGIVALMDVIEDADTPSLVMELVEGETLAGRLLREGALPLTEAMRILRELVQALHHAHSAGVIHRDLKPANILIGKGGVVKVTDFGLAKVATSVAASMGTKGGLMGTPHYMSPEQASGRAIDQRSDLFAVGALGWEMVTGRKAFDGPLSTAIYRIIYEGVEKPSVSRPELPAAFEAAIMRALEKSPEVRFQNAMEMDGALERASESLAVATPTAEMTVVDGPPSIAARETGEMRNPGVVTRAVRSFSGDVERATLLIGLAVAVLIGFAANVMLVSRPESKEAPKGNLDLPPGLHLSGEGTAYLDGERIGELPADVPLPPPGKHLVSIVVPRDGVMRRTLVVEGATYMEVKVGALMPRSAAVPEELEVLGVLVGSAAPVLPLALVREPSGGKGWIHAKEKLAGAEVATIDGDGVVFELPLSPPETESWRLVRSVVPVAEPLDGRIRVGSDPQGMVLSKAAGGAAIGYTPCDLELPQAELVTLVLTDPKKKRELVLRDLDVRRLAFMGELMVVMPPDGEPQSARGTR